MAKQKDPGLADFAVHLYGYQPLKIRATSLIVVDRWVYLRDAGGGILFSAPEANLHYVKRLEPGEAMGAPERLPEPEHAVDLGPAQETATFGATFGGFAQVEPVTVDPPPPAEVADPGPIETGPRRRGSGGRFTKA